MRDTLVASRLASSRRPSLARQCVLQVLAAEYWRGHGRLDTSSTTARPQRGSLHLQRDDPGRRRITSCWILGVSKRQRAHDGCVRIRLLAVHALVPSSSDC